MGGLLLMRRAGPLCVSARKWLRSRVVDMAADAAEIRLRTDAGSSSLGTLLLNDVVC